MPYTQPEPLDKRHLLDGFEWLRKYARAAQASGAARVYITTSDGKTVVGSYALAAGQVQPAAATGRVGKGEPKPRPIPVRQQAARMLACDFFTVDTVLLRQLYVLVFICVGSRRIEYVACTSNPTAPGCSSRFGISAWTSTTEVSSRSCSSTTETRSSHAFDAFFRGEGMRVIRTPVRAPNANAHMERWVGTVRLECLERLLIFNCRQLERIVSGYVHHYNSRSPHRALELQAPDRQPAPHEDPAPAAIHRRDILAGIIHGYEARAA